MRLASRTGLAAFAAALGSLLILVVLFQVLATRILFDRVDDRLEERASSAPILVVIAERLAQSELSGTVEGARVAVEGRVVPVGALPVDPLPDPVEPGWSTETADGQRWRLLTVAVDDVPAIGDEALVQFAAPLGDIEAQTRGIRRRAAVGGLLAAAVAGGLGYLFGAYAARPLTVLRRDAALVDDANPERWQVGRGYGSPDVDDIAMTLNATLARLATETERRGRALDTARAFASSASHEIRVPLQGAMTNLNVAADERLGDTARRELVVLATEQIDRMAAALGAVRDLAQAELVDATAFVDADLDDLVDAAVAQEARGADPPVALEAGTGPNVQRVWSEGVQLAVANLVRNALAHGQRSDGAGVRVVVTVAGPVVIVDDDGPGIPPPERHRVVQRFTRGPSSSGSGLGLAIVAEVAGAHRGSLTFTDGPLGGTRAVVSFAPPPSGRPTGGPSTGPESSRDRSIA